MFIASTAPGQRAPSHFVGDAIGPRAYQLPPQLESAVELAPAVVLAAAEEVMPEKVEAISQWNARGHLPVKDGFLRSTIDPVRVTIGGSVRASGERGRVISTNEGTVWATAIKVERAYRLRLHLQEMNVPVGTRMWVIGSDRSAIGFGTELMDGNSLWTPAVEGDIARLEVQVPRGTSATFVIRELMQSVPLTIRTEADDSSCLVDAQCVTASTMPQIDKLRASVALLSFIAGDGSYICSGGLIADDPFTSTPYLLTAHHCFANQAEASSLEAYWDFMRPVCNGPIPSLSTLPRSYGSTLLASSEMGDFTLVRLNNIPASRWLLGWDPRPSILSAGLMMYRVSHPTPDDQAGPMPQSYSVSTLDLSTDCTNLPRPAFIYSRPLQGAVWDGSSGAPVTYAGSGDLYVIGQLYGTCRPVGADDCSGNTDAVDGSFAATYSSIAQWIRPGSLGRSDICTPGATTLCLSNKRFAVSVSWKSTETQGAGQAVPLTADTGYFTFFQASNVEMVVKVLDGCGVNQRFWVFAGGLTNVQVTMTVIDTKTGTAKVYVNPQSTAFQPIQDTGAFATCP